MKVRLSFVTVSKEWTYIFPFLTNVRKRKRRFEGVEDDKFPV